jgi:uncharacterized membrane protein
MVTSQRSVKINLDVRKRYGMGRRGRRSCKSGTGGCRGGEMALDVAKIDHLMIALISRISGGRP